MSKTGLPTMADVARLAGVSVPTVSRVLSGSAGVKADKRERVEHAVAELGFRPSAAARVLASGRQDVFSVVTANTSTYGYAETLRGVEDAARAAGFAVMITVLSSDDPDEIEQQVRGAADRSVAGVVILKFDRAGVAALRSVPPTIPVVALSGVRDSSVPQAVIDETRAAEELTNYLLGLGHETVHHVRIPPSRREDGRTTGWRRALRDAGARIPHPIDAPWDPRAGRDIGRRLCEDRTVTAVFCGNDEIAIGVMRGIRDAGGRIPDDISVVGFDDHPLSELWEPALTTVRQDFADLGRRGVALLTSAIRGERDHRFSSVRPSVVMRESASSPPGSVA